MKRLLGYAAAVAIAVPVTVAYWNMSIRIKALQHENDAKRQRIESCVGNLEQAAEAYQNYSDVQRQRIESCGNELEQVKQQKESCVGDLEQTRQYMEACINNFAQAAEGHYRWCENECSPFLDNTEKECRQAIDGVVAECEIQIEEYEMRIQQIAEDNTTRREERSQMTPRWPRSIGPSGAASYTPIQQQYRDIRLKPNPD